MKPPRLNTVLPQVEFSCTKYAAKSL